MGVIKGDARIFGYGSYNPQHPNMTYSHCGIQKCSLGISNIVGLEVLMVVGEDYP